LRPKLVVQAVGGAPVASRSSIVTGVSRLIYNSWFTNWKPLRLPSGYGRRLTKGYCRDLTDPSEMAYHQQQAIDLSAHLLMAIIQGYSLSSAIGR
jgi:hypothetical protein